MASTITLNGVTYTPVSLSLGSPLQGQLTTVGQGALYQVSLTAGRVYSFSLAGDATASELGEIGDPLLHLLDSQCATLVRDDDSGGDLNSLISNYIPTTTGTYYLYVSAAGGGQNGGYALEMTTVNALPYRASFTALPSVVGNGANYTLTKASLLKDFADPDGDALDIVEAPVLMTNAGTSLALVTQTSTGWTYKLPSVTTSSSQTVSVDFKVTDSNPDSEVVTASNNLTVMPAAKPNSIMMTRVGSSDHTTEDGGTVAYLLELSNPLTSGSLSVVLESLDETEGKFIVNGTAQKTQTLSFDKTHQSYTVTVQGVQDYDNDGTTAYTIRAQAKDGTAAAATSGINSWTNAIRTFNGGSNTGYQSKTMYNDGDTGVIFVDGEQITVDRDQSQFMVGDVGRAHEDALVGLDGQDRLYGGYMIDRLDGGIGNDRLYGGYEDDQLYGGAGNDQLFGEQDDDRLEGGAGNDRLDGGSGADTLVGQAGNDVYYVTLDDNGNIEDIVIEDAVTAVGGTDTIYIPFAVPNYIADTGIEIIKMVAGFGDTSVAGNSSNNQIIGNAGDNSEDGGLGNDTLDGGLGSDNLIGGGGNDSLIGGAGGDSLIGGIGQDLLTGGTGNDVFIFQAYTDLGTTRATADIVQDFTQGDKISLALLDANSAVAGDQAFTVLTTGFTQTNNSGTVEGFTAAGGQVYYSNGYLYIDNDTDKDAEYVIQITLSGTKTTVDAADLVL